MAKVYIYTQMAICMMGDGGNLENTGKEFTYTPMVTGAHFLKICKQFTILPNPNFIICSF